MHRFVLTRLVAIPLAALLLAPSFLPAQMDGGRGFRGGGRRSMTPEMMERFRSMMPTATPQPAAPVEEKKDDKPKDAAAAAPKVDPGPQAVTRPPSIENPAALREQRLAIDEKRMVQLNFQGAPWSFVLEEVARISGLNLDWQQLPGDSLNLRSPVKYPVAQARDIINAHLLARGYSLLVNTKSGSMSVVNLDNLNTALVPRVSPEDLEALQPHDLVKVSFRLDWLLADKAVEEFKPLLTAKAKLIALKATNRIEAIDAVENLRQLAAMIEEEQGGKDNNRIVREFELRYTRASDVLDQLQTFMGLTKNGAAKGTDPAQAQAQMMMQRMQMVQGQQPQQPGQPPAMGPPKPEVRLIANARRNVILANAPPDQMAIIRAAILHIDVPPDRSGASDLAQSMQTYRLATLDPEVLVNFLDSLGELDPRTRLEVDKKNKAVIVNGPQKDQVTITALVKNLDGSDRQLEVIKLRKLDADLVAGTLKALLVGEEKASASSSGGGRRYGGWFGGFGSSTTPEETTSKFRVDADVVNNRLIVWANKIEYEQVIQCLAKLGEIPRRDRGTETTRVIDPGTADQEQQLLDRLKAMWPANGKNRLIIDVPEKKAEPQPAPAEKPAKQPAARKPADDSVTGPAAFHDGDTDIPVFGFRQAQGSPLVKLTSLNQSTRADYRLIADAGPTNNAKRAVKADPRPVAVAQPNYEPKEQAAPNASAPNSGAAAPADKSAGGDAIFITRGADGRLIVTSRDTQALDQIEEMMARLAPRRKEYEVFKLQHATSWSVKLNLEDFFATEKKDSKDDNFRRFYWGSDDSSDKKDDGPRLSQRRPLKFIEDEGTNSILVQGASPEQLRLIKDLIDLYDRPQPTSGKISRMTKFFTIRHNKASVVADTIKDLYRDLLSANDKALESFNQTKKGNTSGRMFLYDFGGDKEDGRMSQKKFKGELSLGVDDTSNTLLVSCPEYLMHNVEQIVESLDKAAVPVAQTMQVLRIDRSIDAGMLQKKLTEMLGKQSPHALQRPQLGQGTPQQQQQRRRGRGQNQNQGEESSSGESSSNE